MIKMNSNFRSFFYKNLLLTIILIVFGAVLFNTILKGYYSHVFSFLLILALSVNLIIFRLAIIKNKINQSFLLLVLSFSIKFFSYLLVTVVYFLNVDELLFRIAYIFVLFIVFVAYTSLEIKMLTKFFKTN
jgi:hypothetical protein